MWEEGHVQAGCSKTQGETGEILREDRKESGNLSFCLISLGYVFSHLPSLHYGSFQWFDL